MIRLQKILSAAGVSSRRAAEELIRQGRVTVNGTVVRELGTRADPARDDIRADGRRVKSVQRLLYFLLNKPRGYVTTRSDPEGRPTVLDLLKGVREYVYPVGRLDYDSEGLLLLTNDGDLAARLMHPRHEIERVYEARVAGIPDAHDLDRLRRGLLIEGRRTQPADVRLISSKSGAPPSARGYARARGLPAPGGGAPGALNKDSRPRARGLPASGGRARNALSKTRQPARAAATTTALLRITIHEGRSRQVRKMCEATGHPVVRLRRVRIGPIIDWILKPGAYRELSAAEIANLKRAARLPPKV